MSRPSDAELARLQLIAEEISESLAADGYAVDQAISQHHAFKRTRVPASALERGILGDAAERGARQAGMSPEAVGEGIDILSWDENIAQRRYRLKKADLLASGEYRAVCGAGSSLLRSEFEPMMWAEERWILGYRLGDDHTIVDIFAAEIMGHEDTESGPVRLILGTIYPLLPTTPPLGFVSGDEDLDFGEEGDEGERGVG